MGNEVGASVGTRAVYKMPRLWQASRPMMTASEKRYRAKPKTKALAVIRSLRYLRRHKYARIAKRESDRTYSHTPNGKAVQKKAATNYRKTERGRTVRRISKARRRN